MRNKHFIIGLALFGMLVLASSLCSAALLGVNKVNLEFTDVLRSGYAEDTVYISAGSERNISIYYEAQGEIKNWVRFEPSEQPLVLAENAPGALRIIVEPPADARSDTYTGKILLSTGPLGSPSGNLGTNILVAFELETKVGVTDTQILACNIGGFNIKDIEVGYPLEFSATVANTGNVRIRPNFRIKIYDKSQNNLIKEINYTHDEEILPTRTSDVGLKLENSLEPDQYWALVSSPLCGSSETLMTFSVLEKGGISDVGEFVRLESKAWAVTGEIVQMSALFRNRGSRVVSAQFKGISSKDGKVIDVLNSEKLDVRPGETIPLEFYVRPKETGQFRITGRVHYNNKISFEKGTVLNVNEGEAQGAVGASNMYYYVVIIIVVIIIIFLVLIILRKKRKFRY